MPRNARARNYKPASKVYESKKVANPKQQYFPHVRKRVRRPDDHDVSEKRQTTLMSGMMKRTETVGDSEEDEDNMEIEEDIGACNVEAMQDVKSAKDDVLKGGSTALKGRKRTSDIMESETETEDEPEIPTAKRSRTSTLRNKTRSAIHQNLEEEHKVADKHDASPSETEKKEDTKQRRIRRQSTMTQMIDGRKPPFDTPEPEFKPARSTSRRSSSSKKVKKVDKKQKTLTQMVPGLKSFSSLSDGDTEEEDKESAANNMEDKLYNDAMTQRLVKSGLFKPADSHPVDDGTTPELLSTVTCPKLGKGTANKRQSKPIASSDVQDRVRVVTPTDNEKLPAEPFKDQDTEDEYQPTQFIEAPTLSHSTARALQRRATPQLATPAPATAQRRNRSRFSMMSTPERRKVFEIPSSQSPSELSLSTQNTPQKFDRSPLKRRSTNVLTFADTPSKGKKVAFQVPPDTKQLPEQPKLRRFASTIQDSEDEESIISDGADTDNDAGTDVQLSPRKPRSLATGLNIGTETQAMLNSIDEMCVNGETTRSEPSVEPEHPTLNSELSFELGEPYARSSIMQGENSTSSTTPASSHTTPRVVDENEPIEANEVNATHSPSTPPNKTPSATLHKNNKVASAAKIRHLPPNEDARPTTSEDSRQLQDTYPSSPMILVAVSSDEEEEEELPLTPPIKSVPDPRQSSPSPLPKTRRITKSPRIDILASPNAFHPRSKAIEPEGGFNSEKVKGEEAEEASQLSHLYSAAAENQLRSEYATYSQFRPPGPPASSMQVAHDTRFSYQDTPRPLPRTSQQPILSGSSQATTVYESSETQPKNPPSSPSIVIHSTPSKPLKSSRDNPIVIPTSSPTPKPLKRCTTPSSSSQQAFFTSSSPLEPPPPLVIPSSFPSPSKVLTQYHQFSSPTRRRFEMEESQFLAAYHDGDEEDHSMSSPLITRGDGVGASGVGKGYTQWLALVGGAGDGAMDGAEESEQGEKESWEDFSIPAMPPSLGRE